MGACGFIVFEPEQMARKMTLAALLTLPSGRIVIL